MIVRPSLAAAWALLAVAGMAVEPAATDARFGFDLVHAPVLRAGAADGASITVAQIEAGGGRADPSMPVFGGKDFSGISGGASALHATAVACILYGSGPGYAGIAPGVRHVLFGDAGVFIKDYVVANKPIGARIINQSFSLSAHDPTLDALLDRYAQRQGILFVSGANGASNLVQNTPGTMFNGLCVGGCDPVSGEPAMGFGPLADGRSKPDLVAPTSAAYYLTGPPPVLTNAVVGLIGTSMSAPFVSGAAALLMDVAEKKELTREAGDPRVVRSILLTSARKLPSWKAAEGRPLDARFGAGILDVAQALAVLEGGRAGIGETPLCGWDWVALGPSETRRHAIRLPKDGATFIATLAWNRHVEENRAILVPLELRLVGADGRVAASSASAVDNVQHLSVSALAAGDYWIEVVSRAPMPEVAGLSWRVE